MRDGQEHGVACLEDWIVVRGKSKVAHAGKRGIHACKQLSSVGVGCDGGELEIRMGDKQAHQLDPCVARCPNDTNLDSHRFLHLQMHF